MRVVDAVIRHVSFQNLIENLNGFTQQLFEKKLTLSKEFCFPVCSIPDILYARLCMFQIGTHTSLGWMLRICFIEPAAEATTADIIGLVK